jgi:hypothetical protein
MAFLSLLEFCALSVVPFELACSIVSVSSPKPSFLIRLSLLIHTDLASGLVLYGPKFWYVFPVDLVRAIFNFLQFMYCIRSIFPGYLSVTVK